VRELEKPLMLQVAFGSAQTPRDPQSSVACVSSTASVGQTDHEPAQVQDVEGSILATSPRFEKEGAVAPPLLQIRVGR
jgi:hypothetical protein